MPAIRRALIVVGHGSHLNGESATPLLAHLAHLRPLASFEEVVPAFWKEEPSLRDVIRATPAHEAVVVPLFISEGYFTEQVIPRELGLTQPEANRASWVGETRVLYAAPVGTHPTMTAVIEARAHEVLAGAVPPSECALVIVGHGTPRNQRSAESIHHQVRLLRERGGYAEVVALFMDEAPYVEDLLSACRADSIVVVPYFISDGLHTQEDIPEAMGIVQAGHYPVPAWRKGRRIWYAGAVGTAPVVAEVILARAQEALAAVGAASWSLVEPVAASAHRAFAAWARQAPRTFGQVAIAATRAGGWQLCHAEERETLGLTVHSDPHAARHLTRWDDAGGYRPLSTAPTLRHGWCLELDGDEALRHALDGLYPAAVVAWYDAHQGTLAPTPFSESAARQSGMYRPARRATTEQVQEAIRHCCGPARCLKRIAWPLSPAAPLPPHQDADAMPCREACGLLIGQVRQIVTGETDEGET